MVRDSGIEFRRLEEQSRIDGLKTQAERNQLGQFATPTSLAADIFEYARTLLPAQSPIRFLDPAFGTGSFYSALVQVFPASRITQAYAYEIDPLYGQAARDLWNDTPLQLYISDFTGVLPPVNEDEKANLLICNPPYVRHHHIESSQKQRLLRLVEQKIGIRLNGLSGLYCYFLVLSHLWMAKDGVAGWLIPSEFMGVNYGQQIREYLLRRVTLLRIHRFNPTEVQFDDALVSSAVVWFQNSLPPANHSIEFTYGGTLTAPEYREQIPAQTLRSSSKWTKFAASLRTNGVEDNHDARLSDIFTIKRGIATGANKFFMLTPEEIARHELPGQFLTPILPSPRYLSADEIEADARGNPIVDRPLFLLTCRLPEGEVREKYPSLWKYLQSGIEAGIADRYLCQHRSPWYIQEERPPALFLCTYMGRSDTKSGSPFRFILNHSRATAPNVYLMLYPKSALSNVLTHEPDLVQSVWQALNTISPATLVDEGRVYGGGLHKMEPNELGNAPAGGIVSLLPDIQEKAVQLSYL